MAASFATPPAPVAISPVNYASATVSLLEIQRRERDAQMQAEYKPPPMTILQIQEQERKREEARQVEAEFERWWKEEQARLNGDGEIISAHGSGSKRSKKKSITGGNAGQQEKKEGLEDKKLSGDKRNDSSRQKAEPKKQQNRPRPQHANGEQQTTNRTKDSTPQKSRKPHNPEIGGASSHTSKVLQNGRSNTPSKQQSNRNDTNNSNSRPPKPSDHRQRQPRPDQGSTGRSNAAPTIGATVINVAAPAFVPQHTPAFNPRVAAFVPPSFSDQP